jgi:hypothetical protein
MSPKRLLGLAITVSPLASSTALRRDRDARARARGYRVGDCKLHCRRYLCWQAGRTAHPVAIRVMYRIGIYAMGCMIFGGWEIYNASPSLPFMFPAWTGLGGAGQKPAVPTLGSRIASRQAQRSTSLGQLAGEARRAPPES